MLSFRPRHICRDDAMPMERLHFGLLTALVVSLLSAGVATAQETNTVSDLVHRYLTPDHFRGRVKVLPASMASMTIAAAKDSAIYDAPESLALVFDIPLFKKSFAVDVLREVVVDFRRVCAAGEGQLAFTPGRDSISDPVARDEFAALVNEGLGGRFACTSASIPFEVDVSSGKRSSSGPLGSSTSWAVILAVANTNTIKKIRERQARRVLELEAFRGDLKVGAIVAVSSQALPSALSGTQDPAVGRVLTERKHQMCAMVIAPKGSLTQVQVGAATLFVPNDALFPVRKRIRPDQVVMGDWESWCLDPP